MTLELVKKLEGHQGPITHLKYSKDYRYIVSSSEDSNIKIWDPLTSNQLRKFHFHSSSVNHFALNDNDSKIITAGGDCYICWIDVQDESLIRRIKAHTSAINCVCFNYNFSVFVTGSLDCTAQVWDMRAHQYTPVQTLCDAKDSVTSVSAGRYEIFTACLDGKIRIYDVRNNQLTTDNIAESIIHIEISSNEAYILAQTKNSEIKLISKYDGLEKASYKGHICDKSLIKCKYATQDDAVISGSQNGEILLWDLSTSEIVKKVNFGEQPIIDITTNEPFSTIVAGSSDGYIGLFEIV